MVGFGLKRGAEKPGASHDALPRSEGLDYFFSAFALLTTELM